MMDTEIFKIDAPWAEKLRKTRVSFLSAPTVGVLSIEMDLEKYYFAMAFDLTIITLNCNDYDMIFFLRSLVDHWHCSQTVHSDLLSQVISKNYKT